MDKMSQLKKEIKLSETGRCFLEEAELPKHTNPLPIKADNEIKPYEKINTIIIPERATNGDMIKAMFPNCEQKEHINNGYFEMYFDNDLRNASYMKVNRDWWNAPYKKESEDEDL